jgi:chemotaxis signal transduction protein
MSEPLPHPAPDSPIGLAARLNSFTPRASAAIPAAPLPPASALPPPASFRERVRAGAGSADVLVFRVGAERFALPLDFAHEVVEVAVVHPVPEPSPRTLGLVELRGRMLLLVSPEGPLGVAPASAAAMLVLRDGTRRVGLAIDDVDDVHTAALSDLRPPPDGDADGIVLAIARRGGDLVALIDPQVLLAACMAEPRPLETDA